MNKNQISSIVKSLIKKKEKTISQPQRISFKYSKNYINLLKEKLALAWNSEQAGELKPVVKYIIGYGLLGYPIYCFVFVTHNPLIGIVGIGSAIYLAHDTFDFVWERVNIIWSRKR